ncbi:branched-chain amino acid ABC transporter permease [Magnetospirillum sp. 15-1]|uniref:branched-chain amino acid ABC transporter permease n=1 Tax=Magnetospirillum sp. 15-1 TaxID=1979370 RepID=UPI000BBBE4EF|nr:branched-chain amino acid ABC transporter permease [Magnetospirillum sp. 15-1]
MSIDLANQILTGLLTGLVYSLMALGLSVIFGVVRVVNFAHGEMTALAMYAAWALFTWLELDPLVGMPLIALMLFVLGYIMQRGLIDAFVSKPEHIQFILLVAIAIIMVNGSLLTFGPDAHGVQVSYGFDTYEVGPLLVDKVRLLAAAAALGISGLLMLFFRRTMTGKAIRACADNLVGAKVIGLNVKQLYAVTFGIGAACVGAAGALLSLLIDVMPSTGPELTMLAFIIVIVGGLGSMGGALLGGMLIGVSEVLAGYFLMPSMKGMFSFAILILILVLRPQGLMGARK